MQTLFIEELMRQYIPKDRWEFTQDYWWEKYLQKKYYGKTKREN